MQKSYFEEWLKALTRPRRVLLVEDDGDFVELLRREAQDQNCDILQAPSAEQARHMLKTHKFDIAWLDLKLHGMPTGLDVLRFMRAHGIHIPVIFISGHITTETVETARNMGSVAYVAKPTSGVSEWLHGLFEMTGIKSNAPSLPGSTETVCAT